MNPALISQRLKLGGAIQETLTLETLNYNH